jgi:hypothetical protein
MTLTVTNRNSYWEFALEEAGYPGYYTRSDAATCNLLRSAVVAQVAMDANEPEPSARRSWARVMQDSDAELIDQPAPQGDFTEPDTTGRLEGPR